MQTSDPNLAAIATCYEQNIGCITPLVADVLKEIAEDYPPGWFEKAVQEAVESARNCQWQKTGTKTQGNTKGFMRCIVLSV